MIDYDSFSRFSRGSKRVKIFYRLNLFLRDTKSRICHYFTATPHKSMFYISNDSEHLVCFLTAYNALWN